MSMSGGASPQPVIAWEARLGRKESSADFARKTRGHLVRPHHSNAFQLTFANTRGFGGFDLHRPGCDSATYQLCRQSP